MVSARPTSSCKLCVLDGMDKVMKRPKKSTCPGSRYEITLFAISVFILSPASFLSSMVTLSSTLVECDQGNWSLWRKCVSFNHTTPLSSSPDYCKDFVYSPGFIRLSRVALILICLLRAGEILSLFFICYLRSLSALGVKVIVEITTGLYILVSLWLFEQNYQHFLNDTLTGCEIANNYWIVFWHNIGVPCHFLIVYGWVTYGAVHYLCIYCGREEECSECNLYIEAAKNHSYDRYSEIPRINCRNTRTETI